MSYINQEELWDKHIFMKIKKCYINETKWYKNEVSVIYEDGFQEVIFRYNPREYDFSHHDFIGKTKIEAIFMYDRKEKIPPDFNKSTAMFRR